MQDHAQSLPLAVILDVENVGGQSTFPRPCSAPRPPARGLAAAAPPPVAHPNDGAALADPARAA